MLSEAWNLESVNLNSPAARAEVEEFLRRSDLRLEPLEYYAVLRDEEGGIAGGGGFWGHTIKCVAARSELRGQGLIQTLISHLRSLLRERGVKSIFLFTKPENEELFANLAFYPVGKAPQAILMESYKRNLLNLTKQLSQQRAPGVGGAIVMNANPFTKGHPYLVEKALEECDQLYLFPVRAERSLFSYAERRQLIAQGTAHLSRVHILDGGEYIVSPTTFPTYFLKELSRASQVQALLDVDIFARHIAPPLGIARRFVGTEPLDPVTAIYNEAMLQVLVPRGIEVKILPRLEIDSQVVSASRVRQLLAHGQMQEIAALTPPSTYAFIEAKRQELAARSEEGRA